MFGNILEKKNAFFLHFYQILLLSSKNHLNATTVFLNLIQSMTRPRGYKTFFVLNSVEHEILNAHKYTNIKKFGFFKAQLSLECYFSRSYMLKCQQLLAF